MNIKTFRDIANNKIVVGDFVVAVGASLCGCLQFGVVTEIEKMSDSIRVIVTYGDGRKQEFASIGNTEKASFVLKVSACQVPSELIGGMLEISKSTNGYVW